MQLSKEDRNILLRGLITEEARLKRAINAESNQSIKEILDADRQKVIMFRGRVFNEVAE